LLVFQSMLNYATFLLAAAFSLSTRFTGSDPGKQPVSAIIISPQKTISHSALRPCYGSESNESGDCLVQESYCKPAGAYAIAVCNHQELIKQWIATFDDGQPHSIDLSATITPSAKQTGYNSTFFSKAMDQQTQNNSTLSMGERSLSIGGIQVIYKQGIYQVENGQIKVMVLVTH